MIHILLFDDVNNSKRKLPKTSLNLFETGSDRLILVAGPTEALLPDSSSARSTVPGPIPDAMGPGIGVPGPVRNRAMTSGFVATPRLKVLFRRFKKMLVSLIET